MLGFHSLLSRPDTLVIYVLSLTDPEYLGNLEFFVKYGMQARDRCEYYVVVQLDQNKSSADLPQLPKVL
jgi:translation initiation factor eIF-2B subunit epsilon